MPSGYILSVLLLERVRHIRGASLSVIVAGMIGSVSPDFDMLYFYLIDHRQTHHHKYLTHWPLLWLCLVVASILWFRVSRFSKASCLSLVFTAGGVLHLILDSFVGDIWWFAPFWEKPYAMFTVPAIFTPWWLNFVFHWSFAVELLICLWALTIYRRRPSKAMHSACLHAARSGNGRGPGVCLMKSLRDIAQFHSTLFVPVLPETSQVNPQVYGAELAYWLTIELARRGCITSYPHAEDWGWFIEFFSESGSEFAVHCSNIDGFPNQWLLTLRRHARKMFGHDKPPYEEAQQVVETIRTLLESTPEIKQLEWVYETSSEA